MYQSISFPDGIRSHLRWLLFFSVATNLLALALPLHILQVYSKVLRSGSLATLFYLSAIVLVMLVVAAYADFSRRRVARRLANKYLMEIHPDLVRGLVGETDRTVRSRQVVSDARSVSAFLASRSFITLFDLPFSALFLLALYALSFWLGLVASVGLVAMVVVAIQGNRATLDLQNKSEKMDSDAFGFATATLRDTDEIRAMGMVEPVRERWKLKLLAAFEANDDSAGRVAGYSVAGAFIRQATQVLLVSVGALLVLAGETHGGVVFAAIFITNRLLSPVNRTIGSWPSITRSYRAHQKLCGLSANLVRDNRRTAIERPTGLVEAADVHFAAKKDQPHRFVLAGVSMTIRPGKITVVTGEAGSGKTSLARIMAGAMEPGSGEVMLDGTRRADWDDQDWGRAVGYVAQTVKLSPVSVSENITRLVYDFDSDRLLKASKLARAHAMISALPKGYATVLERGEVFLTDKQKMKIALARALYGDPAFVVLDEPDTDLDRADQKELAEIIGALSRENVAVLVFSRRSLMRSIADDVYELKAGKLERTGGKSAAASEATPDSGGRASKGTGSGGRDNAVVGIEARTRDRAAFRATSRASDLEEIRASIDRIFKTHSKVS